MPEELKPTPEKSEWGSPPNAWELQRIGIEQKSFDYITLGLNLDPQFPFFHFRNGATTPEEMEVDNPEAISYLGNYFETVEKKALELGEGVLGSEHQEIMEIKDAISETFSILFESAEEREDTSDLIARSAGSERFRRQSTFPQDVVSGILEDVPSSVQDKNRNLLNPARKELERFIQRVAFASSSDSTSHRKQVSERVQEAYIFLFKKDKDIAKRLLRFCMTKGDSYYVEFDTGSTEITEENIEDLEFLDTFDPKGEIEVAIGGKKGSIPIEVVHGFTYSLQKGGAIPEAFSFAQAFENDALYYACDNLYSSSAAKRVVEESVKYEVVSVLASIKEKLVAHLNGEKGALSQLQDLYLRFKQDEGSFFNDILKDRVAKNGSLFGVPLNSVYGLLLIEEGLKHEIEYDIWWLSVTGIADGTRSIQHNYLFNDYLVRQGFTLPERGGQQDRFSPGLVTSGEISYIGNTPLEDYLELFSQKSMLVAGDINPDSLVLVWGGIPPGKETVFVPKDKNGEISIASVTSVVYTKRTASIPSIPGTELTSLELFDYNGDAIPEDTYEILTDINGYITVKFPEGPYWGSFNFKAEVRKKDETTENLKIPLNKDEMRKISEVLQNEYGFTLLSQIIFQRLQALKPGQEFSTQDLESAIRESSEYSFGKGAEIFGDLLPQVTLKQMGDALDENGKFQIQCDGAYALLSSLLKIYFENTDDKAYSVMPRFSYQNLHSRNAEGVVFSAASHVQVAIMKDGKVVSILDSTPLSDAPLNANLARHELGTDNVAKKREVSSRDKQSVKEEHSRDLFKQLMDNVSYVAWLSKLSDFTLLYFSDLPFIAIPRLYEKYQGIEGKLYAEENGDLVKLVEEQRALLEEYKKNAITNGDVSRDSLPAFPNVSNNTAVLGLLQAMLGELEQKVG